MTDSTVHNLTDIATAGGVQASDLLYAVRPGSPDADYRVNAGALAALAAPFNPGSHAVVAKGGFIATANTYNSGYTRSERRSRAVLGRQPVKSVRLVFSNIFVPNSESANSSVLTVDAAIESISGSGQTVAFTFGGEQFGTIPGGGYVVTDAIYATQFGLPYFPAKWDFRVRTGCSVATTANRWVYNEYAVYEACAGCTVVLSNNAPSATQIGGTGVLSVPSGGTSGDSVAGDTPWLGGFGPNAIIGEWAGAPDVSPMVDGDSIVHLLNDATDNGTTGGGIVVRALHNVNGGVIPFVGVAKQGDGIVFASGARPFHDWLMQFCTHYIGNYGTNDFYTYSQTPAQVLSNWQILWAKFRSTARAPRHIAHLPVIPRTNSTDSWAITANETPVTNFAAGGYRDQINTSIRALVGQGNGPDEYIDINPAVQYSGNTALWATTGTANAVTTDGIHPTATVCATIAPIIAAAAQYWSAATSVAPSVAISASPSTAPNALTALRSGSITANTGAGAENYNALPAAVPGLTFAFYCQNTNGIRAVANGTDIIRLGASASAAGGYARSVTAGSFLSLACVVAGEWAATSSYGTWAAT